MRPDQPPPEADFWEHWPAEAKQAIDKLARFLLEWRRRRKAPETKKEGDEK